MCNNSRTTCVAEIKLCNAITCIGGKTGGPGENWGLPPARPQLRTVPGTGDQKTFYYSLRTAFSSWRSGGFVNVIALYKSTVLLGLLALLSVVEGSRSCAVTVTSSEPVHIRAQTSGTTCGSSGQPWQLDSPAGQRITVSVVDFAPHRPGDGGPAHRRVYGFLVDRTQKTNVSICETSEERATPEVHGGRETTDAQAGFSRDKRLALITSSNSAELLIVRDENLANNFLIRVEGQ